MGKVRGRLRFDLGWADYDLTENVRVGDRLVPRAIDVQLPSTSDLPALAMRIEVRGGIPVCAELTFRAKDDGRDIRTTDLRAVRLEEWIENIVAAVSAQVVDESTGVVTAAVDLSEDAHRAAVATVRAARRGGRRRVTDDLLRRVAETYREHLPSGRPVEAVRIAFGTSHRTAARYVQLARQAGHLAESTGSKREA
jgi:hypothetical protein